MSLYIGAKFFRSETPQNIRYEHDEAACLFTVTRLWLTECTLLRSPRRSQAQTTKEGVFWEVQVNVNKKQRTSGRLDWDNSFFFFIRTRSPPPPPSSPYGRLSYVVFVVDTVKDYSGGYKCQFSVREPVKNPQDWSNMAKSWTLVDKARGRILNMLKLPNKIGW